MKKLVLRIGAVIVAVGTGFAAFSEPISGRLGLLVWGNPIPLTSQSVAIGQDVFKKNCASCHGLNGDGQGQLAGDLQTRPANFNALNRPPAVLAMRIGYGVGQDMPAWKDTLDGDTIWHVVNYLNTLARDGQGRGGDRWWRPANNKNKREN